MPSGLQGHVQQPSCGNSRGLLECRRFGRALLPWLERNTCQRLSLVPLSQRFRGDPSKPRARGPGQPRPAAARGSKTVLTCCRTAGPSWPGPVGLWMETHLQGGQCGTHIVPEKRSTRTGACFGARRGAGARGLRRRALRAVPVAFVSRGAPLPATVLAMTSHG